VTPYDALRTTTPPSLATQRSSEKKYTYNRDDIIHQSISSQDESEETKNKVNIHQITKASKGHQNIVISKYIKPTQGRSSKHSNKITKSSTKEKKEEAYSLEGDS
jgi:hypothetical protein